MWDTRNRQNLQMITHRKPTKKPHKGKFPRVRKRATSPDIGGIYDIKQLDPEKNLHSSYYNQNTRHKPKKKYIENRI